MPPRRSLRSFALVGITLLALGLGGSTELGAQSVIILLAALLILISPPRLKLGMVPTLIPLLFFALALTAFLPADWGGLPEWRRHLTQDLHVPLGPWRTPQPWLTLQACGLLFFGLVWMIYLFSQEWSPAEKSRTIRLLVTGIIFLAAITIASYWTGYRIPGWNQEQNRGWFPNRNQTADVLALAGILNYVIAYKRFEKRSWAGGFWVVGLAIICAALVICYSRSGILMFFGGIGIWHLASLSRPGQGKTLALGVASLLLLLSLFLLFGGTTLERFLPEPEREHPHAADYRQLIQEDCLRVSRQAPVLGTGLGNFEPVFTSMRQASADQNRTLHPESDWLWMVVEMGWLAPLLLLIGLIWWVRQSLPFTPNSGESLRLAAAVAVLMFFLHGFVDVSGHRLGSILVGLLLASLALSPVQRRTANRWVSPLFRLLAVLLIGLSGWWLASLYTDHAPPTTATLNRLQTKMAQDADDGKLASVFETANRGLDLAPLEWSFYFRRASALAFRNNATAQAVADFQIARFLEPHWINLCVNEGEVWLDAGDPAHCVDAWQEALRRAGPAGAPTYKDLLEMSQSEPVVHQGLMEAATTSTDYLITSLNYASPDEARQELATLLNRDPNLSSLSFNQQTQLFAAWYARGDQDDLASHLLTHTDWQLAGWKFLALHFASLHDFEMATATTMRFMPPPVIQEVSSEQSEAVLRSHSENISSDVVEGIHLCQAQMSHNQIDDALATIAELEKIKGCPRYVFYLEATLWVKKQQWEQAWNALQQFEGQ